MEAAFLIGGDRAVDGVCVVLKTDMIRSVLISLDTAGNQPLDFDTGTGAFRASRMP
jgi:hypothetical protein